MVTSGYSFSTVVVARTCQQALEGHSLVGDPIPCEPGPAELNKRVYPPRDPSCQVRDSPGQWAPAKASLELHLLIIALTASLSPEHRTGLM